MSELKLEFVGKQVKDMYGTYIGKVVGLVTDVDGSIESVGVDCGSIGLKQLSYEQLLVQGDFVIYIPRWRMDAQKLVRQKGLTLKRIKALQELVKENDLMKDDAEVVHLKYEKRLHDLENEENQVINLLKSRIQELDLQNTSIKTVIFDAKLQYRSNDMNEETYQEINSNTNNLLEHINLEKEEINSFIKRISEQSTDNVDSYLPAKADSEISNNGIINDDKVEKEDEDKMAVAIGSDENESNWLNEVLAKEMRMDI